MQQGVDLHNRNHGQLIGLRVGLSGGEVSVEDGDYFGDPVIEAGLRDPKPLVPCR
jgi:class 3 adenylate cyclase